MGMTLDEAIKCVETLAEEKKAQAWEAQLQEEYGKVKSCKKCAENHQQLAEWLKDYKRLLEQRPCGDAISRQAVLDATICDGISCKECAFFTNTLSDCLLYERINRLPSVNPQTKMECKGCTHEKTGTYPCSHCSRCYMDKYKESEEKK